MKSVFVSSVCIAIILSGCSDSSQQREESSKVDTILLKSLVEDGSLKYWNNQLFTGCAFQSHYNGSVEYYESYVKGELKKRISFYESGDTASVYDRYGNDVAVKSRSYYQNGQKEYSFNFNENNALQGEYKKWAPNGTLIVDRMYNNGTLPDGTYRDVKYDENDGELYMSSEETWKNGIVIYHKEYDNDGKVSWEEFYDETGLNIRSINYQSDGIIVTVEHSYDDEGKLVSDKSSDNLSGSWDVEYFDENGAVYKIYVSDGTTLLRGRDF